MQCEAGDLMDDAAFVFGRARQGFGGQNQEDEFTEEFHGGGEQSA